MEEILGTLVLNVHNIVSFKDGKTMQWSNVYIAADMGDRYDTLHITTLN